MVLKEKLILRFSWSYANRTGRFSPRVTLQNQAPHLPSVTVLSLIRRALLIHANAAIKFHCLHPGFRYLQHKSTHKVQTTNFFPPFYHFILRKVEMDKKHNRTRHLKGGQLLHSDVRDNQLSQFCMIVVRDGASFPLISFRVLFPSSLGHRDKY